MTHVDIDSLDEEGLERYIEGVDRSREARPSEHQLEGGAPLELSVVMLASSLAGIWASLNLVLAERTLLKDPDAALSCDLNPLIGCSTFLSSSANTLFFGIPNALFGLAFFSGVTALALVFLGGGRAHRWVWRLFALGMLGASAWLVWFQYQSFVVEGSLCPYCLVTWFATIPLIVHVLARAAQAGHLPVPAGARRILVKGRWALILAIYVGIALIATVRFWDSWDRVL